MALLLASSMNHTAHPGIPGHIGPNKENYFSRCLSNSSQNRKRVSDLSLRSRAQRISSELGSQKLSPWEIPKRDWFPSSFLFGAATSAYQIEGAWNIDGKGPSSWDHFCHNFPDWIEDKSSGDVGANSYYMYADDVCLLKEMGMDAYRFSISWSRILPKGSLDGGINKEGIKYYHKLIDLLLENGIEPYITIFHWDTPQALADKYGGFLDQRIVKDYTDFAKVCFENFGKKVKNWFTFNEPCTFSSFSFGTGVHAPARCSPGQKCAIPTGNSLTEPYIVAHNILRAHAEAVDLYNKYHKGADGRIGLALDVMGQVPYTNTFLDKQAVERAVDNQLGWFLEPVVRGEYPFSMRASARDRVPYFTDIEQKKLVGSYDIIGLNYYSSRFSKHVDISTKYSPVLNTDDSYASQETIGPDGNAIGPITGSNWINLYPKGLHDVLMITKNKYGNPPIFITENGMGDIDNGDLPRADALEDHTRLDYIQRHLAALKQSVDAGADVRGYFAWSLLDNFEWARGYTERFGLIYVDRNDGCKRYMKRSAKWLKEFNNGASAAKTKVNQNNKVLTPASA